MTGASCIVNRELILTYGPHQPKLENLSDWFLFHTIALKEGIGYIPEVLTSMRVHEKSLTHRVKNDKKRRRKTYRYLLHLLRNNDALRHDFLQSGLLDFVFRDLKWKLYLNPRYSSYWRRY